MDPSVEETWVGVGTNGADFARLVQGSADTDISVEDGQEIGEITGGQSFTDFYKDLQVFADIEAVTIHWQSAAGRTGATRVPIEPLWRKAWVKQLSACKTLQWLVAETGKKTIGKPRKDKPKEVVDFAGALSSFFGTCPGESPLCSFLVQEHAIV